MKAIVSDSDTDWFDFRRAINAVTAKIKIDKKEYFANLYEKADSDNNCKSLFRITKEQLGWNTEGPPSALVMEDEYITKPREIAGNLTKYFD